MFNHIKENPENFKPKFSFHPSPTLVIKTTKSSNFAPRNDLDTHPAEPFSQKLATAPTQQKQLKPESTANHHPSPAPHPPPLSRIIRKKKVKAPPEVINKPITAFFPPKKSEQKKVEAIPATYKPAQDQ